MKKQTTLADVARAAGVSKMTASRALRGDKNVSASSRAKVKDAAKSIGYSGNVLAATLSGKRSDLIGVVVPSFANVVFAEALSGITEALAGQASQPVFGVSYYDNARENQVIRNMLSWRPSGLIVTGLEQSRDTQDLLKSSGVPIVQMMDTDADPIDVCVGLSHTQAAYDMASALLARGRRRFGYVGRNLHKDMRGLKRKEGFAKALAEHGLDYVGTLLGDGPTSIASGREMTAALLAEHPDLDGIYYAADDMAFGGLCHCMQTGISVPEQIVLVGFNGLDVTKGFEGKIATTLVDRHSIGKKAAEVILAQMRDPNSRPVRKVVIEPTIELGDFARL